VVLINSGIDSVLESDIDRGIDGVLDSGMDK
jgi:hypothetical protein